MEKAKKTRIWLFLITIVFLIFLIIGMFFYFVTASPSKPKTIVGNPIPQNATHEEAVLEFSKEYIDYLVFAIGGWKLHNPPLSKDTPKIKVIVDDEVYISEIIKGEIVTEKSSLEKTSEKNDEDVVIRTTRQEIVDVILSEDMGNYAKESFQEGRSSFELKAGYTELFSKGYLNIYKDVTGKSFTGSVIRIFGQG